MIPRYDSCSPVLVVLAATSRLCLPPPPLYSTPNPNPPACGLGAILGGFFMRGTSFSWPLMMLGVGVGLVGCTMLYRNVLVRMGVARS
jgi:hypothetical protein